MYDVMSGVKVIEVAEHTFVPAAGMILSDWGAEVIKIERVGGGGDPGRNLAIPNTGIDGRNMYFEAGNRGKRSVALDLTQERGKEILYGLIDTADVFITNLRSGARKKLGIEPGDLMRRNPKLVYARGTGYGLRGPMRDDGGFDYPSSWCRSGAGYMQTLPGQQPPVQPGSVGDLGGGATLAGAISAALFRRERTGRGAIVDNALYLVGTYLMSQSIVAASMGLKRGANAPREQDFSALVNLYRTRDDRWLSICLLMEAWWPDFTRHLDRDDLLTDPRFATGAARTENKTALIAELDATIGAKDYDYWRSKLATLQGVWAPLQTPQEVVDDPQALENGFVTEVMDEEGVAYLGGASPAQFDEAPIGSLRVAPAYGADTISVLRGLGMSDTDLDELRGSTIIL